MKAFELVANESDDYRTKRSEQKKKNQTTTPLPTTTIEFVIKREQRKKTCQLTRSHKERINERAKDDSEFEYVKKRMFFRL